MTEPQAEIRSVPIHLITVLNPRVRNKRTFQELVNSIARLGLKKPITVSQRPGKTDYDLVCGQGRLEAFIALGQKEIPAVMIEASEEDCYIMSLVENLARRQHGPLELVHAIGALSERGYSHQQIAAKVDYSIEYVSAICLLLKNGEGKLIAAVERGIMPPSIAMEIARARDGEVQKALAKAYEEKIIPGNQVLAIRKIIEQRNASGKDQNTKYSGPNKSRVPTSEGLIRAYQREANRRKLLVKRASLARGRLLFVTTAMRRLLGDDQFVLLLRRAGLATVPRPLAERIRRKD
jgi:ParB family transcriptional regulator, chromosome partitioning protein